ncbi:MAG: AraC family transcriptional regulator [Sulfuricurvum sp.]|nr:AraC family transcriptional regulator [Sulfuricurvum sp.]
MTDMIKELIPIVDKSTKYEGINQTAMPFVQFFKAFTTSQILHTVYEPSLFIILQGAKIVTLGSHTYRYDPLSYLVSSVHLPVAGQIIEASESSPFLSIQITFTPEQIYKIAEQLNYVNQAESHETSIGISMKEVGYELIEAVHRLICLSNKPTDIDILAPLYLQEVLYRLLQSDHAKTLMQFAPIESNAGRIAKSIQLIKKDLFQSISIQELADHVGMSISSFHKHFKIITTMSPIQYRKLNRLQEARRLMLLKHLDVSDASFQVGYESPSQFSREYTRYFGLPPSKDIKKIKEIWSSDLQKII